MKGFPPYTQYPLCLKVDANLDYKRRYLQWTTCFYKPYPKMCEGNAQTVGCSGFARKTIFPRASFGTCQTSPGAAEPGSVLAHALLLCPGALLQLGAVAGALLVHAGRGVALGEPRSRNRALNVRSGPKEGSAQRVQTVGTQSLGSERELHYPFQGLMLGLPPDR